MYKTMGRSVMVGKLFKKAVECRQAELSRSNHLDFIAKWRRKVIWRYGQISRSWGKTSIFLHGRWHPHTPSEVNTGMAGGKRHHVVQGIAGELPRFESYQEPLEPSHTCSGKNAQHQKGIKKIAQKVWRQVTPTYLEMLYESMPRRMQAVIEAQGGHTKY